MNGGADGLPAMVSVMRGDSVVAQREADVHQGDRHVAFFVPPGIYGVRVEAEGIKTEIKTGIHIFDGGSATNLYFTLRPGEGVRMIEYTVSSR